MLYTTFKVNLVERLCRYRTHFHLTLRTRLLLAMILAIVHMGAAGPNQLTVVQINFRYFFFLLKMGDTFFALFFRLVSLHISLIVHRSIHLFFHPSIHPFFSFPPSLPPSFRSEFVNTSAINRKRRNIFFSSSSSSNPPVFRKQRYF